MGRNRGFTAALVQIQREADRRARAQVAAVELRNEELAQDVAGLQMLLADTLAVDDFLDFDALKQAAPKPVFSPGQLAVAEPAPDPDAFSPPRLTGLRAHLPGAKEKYQAQWVQGRHAYEAAVAEHQQREADRVRRLEAAKAEHARKVAEVEARLAAQHAEVEAFKADFQAGKQQAVTQYFALVLEASRYPDGFPQRLRLAYVSESRQLVVEYELPPYERIPTVGGYRYVKAGDKITETARPAAQRKALYKSVVAQATVRTLHELFEADRAGWSRRSCSMARWKQSMRRPAGPNDPAW